MKAGSDHSWRLEVVSSYPAGCARQFPAGSSPGYQSAFCDGTSAGSGTPPPVAPATSTPDWVETGPKAHPLALSFSAACYLPAEFNEMTAGQEKTPDLTSKPVRVIYDTFVAQSYCYAI